MRQTTILPLLILALATAAAPGRALAQQDRAGGYTEITGTGQALYRIAVAPCLDGGGAGGAAKTVQDVIANDMTLAGLFKVIDPKSFLANLAQEGTGINPQVWAQVGAQGVVKAKASAAGGKVSVEFFLYDVGKGASPVLAKTYAGPAKATRQLAHKFSDDIYRFYTNERGVFQTKIAFTVTNPRAKTSFVYGMDYDGYGVYLVSNTGKQSLGPAWSPSGQIAFTSFLWKNPDLYLTGGSGGRAARISKWPGLNSSPAFSPSGELAVTLSRDGNPEIYLIYPTTGAIKARLTNSSAIDTSPSFSPDGGRIAFVSNRAGSPQIYVMGASGGGARRLTFKGGYNQEPSWCPRKENNVVAFTGRDDGGNYDIFTVNVDSGEMKRLTQGQGSNKSPSWAPNGRLIVFSSSRGGLWLMTDDGLNQHAVYKGGGSTPAWSK
jgi:TolB protein